VQDDADVKRYRLPDVMSSAGDIARLVRDELLFDANPRLNLATYCTTEMEPEAQALMTEALDRNLVDRAQYPRAAELERRCLDMIGGLWHQPGGQSTGTSTTGSSEAAQLAGLALRSRWRRRRAAAGLAHDRPNLVLGAGAHVCWQKFCRYWDVEPRIVPVTEDQLTLDPGGVAARCDANTIGAVAVLGGTELGRYDPVEGIAEELDRLRDASGTDVPVHVDAAAGGFVAPFLQPGLIWDFRLERVHSINASAHKYGGVYPALGWLLWREASLLPEDLVFEVTYLGATQRTCELAFSRPAAPVVAQYYNLQRLGYEGYRQQQQTCQDIAQYLAAGIKSTGQLRLLSDGTDLPVVAAAVADPACGFTVFDIAGRLGSRGWHIPAYPLPVSPAEMAVFRIVVRTGFTRTLADTLLDDFDEVLTELSVRSAPYAPAS
jgi:glutamate decarboxylase